MCIVVHLQSCEFVLILGAHHGLLAYLCRCLCHVLACLTADLSVFNDILLSGIAQTYCKILQGLTQTFLEENCNNPKMLI